MAGCAGVIHGSMLARSPVHPFAVFMALQADGGLLFRAEFALGAEGNDQRRLSPRCVHMLAHGAVTGLTVLDQVDAVFVNCKILHVFFMALNTLGAAFNKSRPLDIRV